MARPNDPRLEVDDVWQARIRCASGDKSYIAQEMDRDPGAAHEPLCASCAAGMRFFRGAYEEARAYAPAERDVSVRSKAQLG